MAWERTGRVPRAAGWNQVTRPSLFKNRIKTSPLFAIVSISFVSISFPAEGRRRWGDDSLRGARRRPVWAPCRLRWRVGSKSGGHGESGAFGSPVGEKDAHCAAAGGQRGESRRFAGDLTAHLSGLLAVCGEGGGSLGCCAIAGSPQRPGRYPGAEAAFSEAAAVVFDETMVMRLSESASREGDAGSRAPVNLPGRLSGGPSVLPGRQGMGFQGILPPLMVREESSWYNHMDGKRGRRLRCGIIGSFFC